MKSHFEPVEIQALPNHSRIKERREKYILTVKSHFGLVEFQALPNHSRIKERREKKNFHDEISPQTS